jgi:hypothetical protein
VVPVERDEMMRKIHEDEDFIHAPKHQNSLNKLLAKTDNILENGAIGRLLLIPDTQVEEIYQESIAELRKEMLDEEGSE